MPASPAPDGPARTLDLPADDPACTLDLPAGGPDTGRRPDTSVDPADLPPPPDDDANLRTRPLAAAPDAGTVEYPGGETAALDRTGAFSPTGDGPGKVAEARAAVSPPGYEVLGVLGRGGMGVVYKARQTGLNRIVALKMILAGPHAGGSAVARFLAEAQAVARFQHPGLVQVFDIGEHAGHPFFSLEYVDGGTLDRKIHKEPQPQRYAAEMVEQLARAMQYAHDRGIAHRDLKPANVLLTADGHPKIADFGLAKQLDVDSGQTQSGTIMGTPSYMAPEQADGRTDVGAAADVYALGAILYDLLTGRPPFAGSSVLDTLEMVRTREPVAPGQLAKLPKDIETVCLKCLHKDPARRYPSAAALADDLRAFLDGRPITARPVGRIEKGWRWAKRNRLVAGLSAFAFAAAAVVLVGGPILSWQMYQARNQAITERDQKEEARAGEAKAKELAVEKSDLAAKKEAIAGLQWNQGLATVRQGVLKIDEKMRNRADLAPLRLDLLTAMLADLDKLKEIATADPFADAAGRLTAEQVRNRSEGLAAARIGDVYQRAGRVTDAEPWLEKAHAVYAAELAADPDGMGSLRNLAAVANQLSDVKLRLGDATAARTLRAAALDVRRKRLAVADARGTANDQVNARQDVAISLRLVADADLALGDPAAAATGYAAADAGLAALPPARANTADIRRERLSIQDHLGDARLKLGDRAGAAASYRAALTAREAMVKANVKPPELHLVLRGDAAQSHLTLGDFLVTDPAERAAAVAAYTVAHERAAGLVKEQPDDLQLRWLYGHTLYRLGVTADDPTTAAGHFTACLKLRAELAKLDPTDTRTRIEWMLALGQTGQTAEAEKLAGELAAKFGTDRRVLFQVACGYAVAAGRATDPAVAARCRALALTTLGQLIERGWKDRVALETDPDLTAVRTEKGFGELLSRVPTPAGGK